MAAIYKQSCVRLFTSQSMVSPSKRSFSINVQFFYTERFSYNLGTDFGFYSAALKTVSFPAEAGSGLFCRKRFLAGTAALGAAQHLSPSCARDCNTSHFPVHKIKIQKIILILCAECLFWQVETVDFSPKSFYFWTRETFKRIIFFLFGDRLSILAPMPSGLKMSHYNGFSAEL